MAAGSSQQAGAPPLPHDGLVAALDTPLPAWLEVGRGTAVLVAGTCHMPRREIRSLHLVVDGDEQPLAAVGMPRIDRLQAAHDPAAYRSGFWGLAEIRPGDRPAGAPIAVEIRAGLADGGTATALLARIAPRAPAAPVEARPPDPGAGPLVAICMATHQPPPALLRRQLDSIRAQTHRNWICVISDDASDDAHLTALEAAVVDDPRFVLCRSSRRLGFYRNFERALALAPLAADHVALADQDDAWYPEKLATLLASIGSARLAYSDARVVGEDGRRVADTYWGLRSNNHDDMASLLITNAVTGAASLFPRSLLDDALPFPPAQFAHFHDHWLAVCALATGEIRYVQRPLYDYVQHGDAFVGHAMANRMPSFAERLGHLRRNPRHRLRLWRMHYFGDVCRLLQFCAVLRLRCGERLRPDARRALERFTAGDRTLTPLLPLAWRGLLEITGVRRETLGGEWMLAHAFAWRHLIRATADVRPSNPLRLDALPPPPRDPTPEAREPQEPALRAAAAKIAPLDLRVRADAPPRVNVLVPTIDLRHLFAGYLGKYAFAVRLADAGARVRLVTVDPTAALPASWPEQLAAAGGPPGLLDRVEVAFGRESLAVEVSPEDRFVATTWWTAHIADAAVRELGRRGFLYLVQEHEPFTFPMGSYAALAAASYRLEHTALFSTELLLDWFRARAIGVFASDAEEGDRRSAVFRNAITPVEPPPVAELAARRSRRLLVYARPEEHAARNMYELALLALSRALERGQVGPEWRLDGIGTVEGARDVDLGAGRRMRLLPRTGRAAYAEVLREHDVGLALMHTPHPSLVPIEMASAGMLVVTSTFETKTAERLAAISSNLIGAEPELGALADALGAAVRAAGDAERRVRGSHVDWSRDWADSFPDELMRRVLEMLEA